MTKLFKQQSRLSGNPTTLNLSNIRQLCEDNFNELIIARAITSGTKIEILGAQMLNIKIILRF